MMGSVDLVFWPASARVHGFRGHVEAARAGGFTSLAIAPEGYAAARSSGLSPHDMRSMANDAGAPLRYLDTLTDWAPIRVPSECSPELRARFDVDSETIFRICDELELTSILAVAGYDAGAVEQQRLVDGFGQLCEVGKKKGLWIDLEFMPFWGMPNLSDAWRIIDALKPDNAGIMVDIWHFCKGDFDVELLKAIPGRFLTGMQINDGVFRQVGMSLFDDTIHYRNFPGEGELPVVEVLKIVATKAHLRNVGPEVFSIEADALSAAESGKRSGDTTRAVLREAAIQFQVRELDRTAD